MGKMPNIFNDQRMVGSLESFVIEAIETTATLSPNLEKFAVGEVCNSMLITRQVRAIIKYLHLIEKEHRILDWGAKQSIDGGIIKSLMPSAEVHACDFYDERAHQPFAARGVQYKTLESPFLTPYENKYFDVVVGDGVLEHVPNEQESLKEVWRVTKDYGYFIILFLPNKYSYTEFIGRRFGVGHARLYSLDDIDKKLRAAGFLPLEFGYHQLLPSLASAHRVIQSKFVRELIRRFFKLDRFAERIPLLRRFSSNIYVISKKVPYF